MKLLKFSESGAVFLLISVLYSTSIEYHILFQVLQSMPFIYDMYIAKLNSIHNRAVDVEASGLRSKLHSGRAGLIPSANVLSNRFTVFNIITEA